MTGLFAHMLLPPLLPLSTVAQLGSHLNALEELVDSRVAALDRPPRGDRVQQRRGLERDYST